MAHFFCQFLMVLVFSLEQLLNRGYNETLYGTRIFFAVQRCHLNSISSTQAWSSPTSSIEALVCIQLTAKPTVLVVNDVHLLAECSNITVPSCTCGQPKNSARESGGDRERAKSTWTSPKLFTSLQLTPGTP